MFSVRQVHELTGIPLPTLYRWIDLDHLPAAKLGPTRRVKRIPRQAVLALLEARANSDEARQAFARSSFKRAIINVPADASAGFGIGDEPDPAADEVDIARQSAFVPSSAYVPVLDEMEQKYGIPSADMYRRVLQGVGVGVADPDAIEEWVRIYAHFEAAVLGERLATRR